MYMSAGKVAVIAGYGTGISAAVAKRFGSQGYKLALLARTQSRLEEAVAELSTHGITAKPYPTDLSNAAAVRTTITAVHSDLGAINLIHWNAYAAGSGSTSFLDAPPEQFQKAFDVSVTGLIAAVQAAHEDLKTTQGTILITGGGLALEQDMFAQMASDYNMASLAIAKAAQRKLVHIMHKGLRTDGIYVAEVTVCGAVRGTEGDPESKSSLTPEAIAEQFWQLAEKREPDVWFKTIS